jgi:imidazolonepropionase-like amidohydrolase
MKIFPILLIFLIGPTKNLRQNPPNVFALKNAKIILNSKKVIENGTIIVREGKIEDVGKNVKIPSDAYEIDLSGKWIYPGFIEPYLLYKIEEKKKDFYLSPKVHPEIDISEIISIDESLIKKYRENGFTAALFVPSEGIFKGKSAVFSLKEGEKSENLIKKEVFEHIAFEYYKREKEYPNSFMGAIALVRQIFYDAIWHKEIWEYYEKNKNIQKPPFINSLSSLYPFLYKNHKVCFEIEDDIDIYRVLKIKKEFNLNVVIRGSSYEYRQIDVLKKEKIPIILPINFPEKLDFETPEEAIDISLKELLHFEYAPWNPKKLWENNVEFAFTTDGLKDIKIFFKNLKEVIKRGLPENYVLKALTENPAKILGIDNLIGSIEKGKLAHLIITDGNIFKDGKIYEVWIEDKIYKIKEENLIKPFGKWEITFYFPEGKKIAEIEINEDEKLKGDIIFENEKIPLKKIEINLKHLDILFDSEKIGHKGLTFISGIVENKNYKGKGILPCGKEFNFEGFLKEEIKKEEKMEKKEIYEEPKIFYPPCEFGREFLPEKHKYILIKNARIWTCSNKGVLEGYDILIKDGKFYKIGKNLKEKNALIIDASGKDITPGIVDPHSHIAIKGENNETGDIVTSEVRIEDVIDPYDISIYRVLAGGVTVSNILHGSANVIGGQNVVIKHKWGVKNPDELIFKKGIPTLKFALGENPKYGEDEKFPQTRMGIEEILKDKFKEAIDYKHQKMNFKYPLRKNLEIEPILEVIENKRMPYVHAYRADEMLTFLKLAKEFGIKKVSFQHALEAYKIIDKLKEFGAYATVFSDLWAYKFETYDGIPYNAAMLYKNGIIVSLHSDFSEVARRLNTEAAKSMKYGGLNEEEALKLITIYPAIQLGIDKYVGSIEEGKDADFVIWDGNPLSTYSKVLETWIEGKKYFDREEDLRMRERDERERFRIIQKYLREKKEEKK